MKRSTLLAIMLLCAYVIVGQNIEVTFTGTGEATVVDSVKAKNMSTGEVITFPGNETLVLENTTGINNYQELKSDIRIFPNPVQNNSKLMFDQSVAGNVQIRIQNLMGQVLYQLDEYLEVGQHLFDLSLNKVGVFLISMTSENETRSIKAISAEANDKAVGLYRVSVNSSNQSSFKSFSNTYSLAYSPEHVLHFTCNSSSYTTIITDSPTVSQYYKVEFVACVDSQSNSYSVVKIGDQTWMAENLVYLPTVSPPNITSSDDALIYVYDYSGSSIAEAMNTESFKEYGALYNWMAAMEVCPDGWHLPEANEWDSLILFLERNGYGSAGFDHIIAKSLASSNGWKDNNETGTVGKDQPSNNKSGFGMLPGGYLYFDGFMLQGERTSFWSSTRATNRPNSAKSIGTAYDRGTVDVWTPDLGYSFSVRCVKTNN